LGKRVLKGFNDLKTLNPNLATQAFGWDPSEISISSKMKLTPFEGSKSKTTTNK
jgi:hypothetical protein